MIERKIFDSLKEGNRLLQLLNNELSIEKINKLIDETAEAVKYQKVQRLLYLFRVDVYGFSYIGSRRNIRTKLVSSRRGRNYF
jgi:hypothetical protein